MVFFSVILEQYTESRKNVRYYDYAVFSSSSSSSSSIKLEIYLFIAAVMSHVRKIIISYIFRCIKSYTYIRNFFIGIPSNIYF